MQQFQDKLGIPNINNLQRKIEKTKGYKINHGKTNSQKCQTSNTAPQLRSQVKLPSSGCLLAVSDKNIQPEQESICWCQHDDKAHSHLVNPNSN